MENVRYNKCPECGTKDFINKNLVGDGYRECKKCGQGWWTDINYEEFKCVTNMPWYRIGNNGTIISDLRSTPKILKQGTDKDGYKKISLSNNGKRVYMQVHRLVAISFIDNPNNLPQVNHKDGDKTNNHYKNLEWCDQYHNMQHAVKNGLHKNPEGENQYLTKLSNNDVKDIRSKIKEGISYSKISKDYQISKSAINRIKLKQSFKNI